MFLAIAIAGAIPVLLVTQSINLRSVIQAVASVTLISIPASLLSLLFALIARKESALAYISILPALGILLYGGYVWWRLS